MVQMILGIFKDRTDAQDAILELESRGYNPRDISIVMQDKTEAQDLAADTGAEVSSGIVSGATTGGALGALAGLLVGTGVIPGLGVLLIGGPIAAVLGLTGAAAATVSGAATGALAGGLLGGLTSLGLSDEDAKLYEQSIQDGGILVAVPARRGEEAEVESTLADFRADQIKSIEVNDSKVSSARADESRDSYRAYASSVSKRRK